MSTWLIDPIHSEVKFKVKHLMVSTVTGHFTKFNATVTTAANDFSDATISFETDVNSITTNNEQRDGHLKSPDFFDATTYPTMKFVSTHVSKKDDGEFTVVGDLTIRDITKQVTLEAIYNGTVTGFGGATVAGFELLGKINRSDFGLTMNALTEAGGIIVGEEVKLDITGELVRQ